MFYSFAASVNKEHYKPSLFTQISHPPSLYHRVQLTGSCPRGRGTLTHPYKCAAIGGFFFFVRSCLHSGFAQRLLEVFFPVQLLVQRLCTASIGVFFFCAAVCTAVLHSGYWRLFFLRSCLYSGSAQLLFFPDQIIITISTASAYKRYQL